VTPGRRRACGDGFQGLEGTRLDGSLADVDGKLQGSASSPLVRHAVPVASHRFGPRILGWGCKSSAANVDDLRSRSPRWYGADYSTSSSTTTSDADPAVAPPAAGRPLCPRPL
ncbi:MAG: hypothetical protein AVDCRST_MAG59-849, partial [uncultured Thermomicrobiales bacterium]